ncbi:MAG: biotin--[acetyl-CoA-carboxylase] ligase [Chthoniobacterales bacterium]
MSPADPLDAGRLRRALGGQRIGNRIEVLDETTSTNDVVASMTAENDEGLVVFAEQQTAGRGQYGRRWESADGKGIWLSLLLRPQIGIAESSRITDFLAQAIATAVAAELQLVPTIKAPNDIYVGDQKVAGVLVEMRVEPTGRYCAIAGIGINANQQLADFPAELQKTATSLALATGNSIDRTAFAIALLRELDARYAAGQL